MLVILLNLGFAMFEVAEPGFLGWVSELRKYYLIDISSYTLTRHITQITNCGLKMLIGSANMMYVAMYVYTHAVKNLLASALHICACI